MTLSRKFAALIPLSLLGGCHMVVMSPAGDVAVQQRDLILIATGLMLLIIVPVITLTLVFARQYRQSNTDAVYDPEWHHSTRLEIVIWAAPLTIVVVLGAITWMSTHLLDPYRPLTRVAPSTPIAAGVKPLRVEVVALDWKWLFLYPDLGVATVNELDAPVNTPIEFKITASSVMNSFFVPALAGQIYAMPGMETKLHAVINTAGDYEGFSANYSGAGFSDMRFKFHGLSQTDFDRWTAAVKAGGGRLDRPGYLVLERPSEREPARRYAAVDADLYNAILNRCVDRGKMCISDMTRTDAYGGLGLAGVHNVVVSRQDPIERRGGESTTAKPYVAAICTHNDGGAATPSKSSGARLALARAAVALR